ncbi:TadG family pilus assembly protein [soil metagenome]
MPTLAARRRDERGAVAIIAAAVMAVLVLIGAFVVDIGMQRVARRDMQSLADVVALDLSRELDGRSVATLNPLMPALATASRQRNGGTLGSTPVLSVDLGSIGTTGVFTVMSSGSPTAVRVRASTRVGFAFGVASSGGASRSAIGTSDRAACFMLGSFAVAVNSGSSSLLAPLTAVTGLNLSLLSYQGLASASLSVADLVATGQIGTADQLLSGAVTYGQLQAATLAALNNQTPRNTAAITALNAAIAATTNANRPVSVPGIISIDPTSASALATQFNVLNLIAGAATIANGTNAAAVTGLFAGIPGVGGVTVNNLSITERPSTTCGTVSRAPTAAACAVATAPLPFGCAQNSQLRANLGLALSLSNVPVGSSIFKVSSIGSTLALDLGNASGVLQAPEPTCGAGTLANPDTLNVGYSTSLATASLTTGLHFETNALDLGFVLGKVIVKVDVTAASTIPAPPATGTAALQIPPNDVTPVSGGSDVRLSALSTAAPTVTLQVETVGGLPIIGATLGLVTTALNALFNITTVTAAAAVQSVIVNALNPLIATINSAMIGPLASLLGLDVAGADVYAVDRVRCTVPRLVG